MSSVEKYIVSRRKIMKLGPRSKAVTIDRHWLEHLKLMGVEPDELVSIATSRIIVIALPSDEEEAVEFVKKWIEEHGK
jgi:hypothetical protein